MSKDQKRRVLILQDGTFGQDSYATNVQQILDEALRLNERATQQAKEEGDRHGGHILFEVEVALTEEEFKRKLTEKDFDLAVMVSIGMLDVGQYVAEKHPRTVAVVLAGRKPGKQPYIVPKRMIDSLAAIDALLSVCS